MDELKLSLKTKIIKNIITKLLSKIIKEKLGCNVTITLNELDMELTEGIANVHINVDAKMNGEDLMNIIKTNIG